MPDATKTRITLDEKGGALTPGKKLADAGATAHADGPNWTLRLGAETYQIIERRLLRASGAVRLRALIAKNVDELRGCAVTTTQSGGVHLIARNDPVAPWRSSGFKGFNLDVLADGKQIVAPGAWRADGKRYVPDLAFADLLAAYPSLELAPLPDTLIAAGALSTTSPQLGKQHGPRGAAPGALLDSPGVYKRFRVYVAAFGELEESRHDRAAGAVRRAADFGLTDDAAIDELMRVNDEGVLYDDPIDDDDFENFLRRQLDSREGDTGCDYDGSWEPGTVDDGADFGPITGEDAEDFLTPEQRAEVRRLVKRKGLPHHVAVERVMPEETLKAKIEAMNANHAIVRIGGKARVLREMRRGGRVVAFELEDQTAHALVNANNSVIFTDESGKESEVKVAAAWMKSHNRRTFDRLIFDPREKSPQNLYNAWRGFAIKPDAAAGSCDLFLEYVREIIANGDEAIFNWIIGYVAHMIQKPGHRPKTAVVFRGDEGVGKSTFGAMSEVRM